MTSFNILNLTLHKQYFDAIPTAPKPKSTEKKNNTGKPDSKEESIKKFISKMDTPKTLLL